MRAVRSGIKLGIKCRLSTKRRSMRYEEILRVSSSFRTGGRCQKFIPFPDEGALLEVVRMSESPREVELDSAAAAATVAASIEDRINSSCMLKHPEPAEERATDDQNEGCRLEVFGLTTFITEASEDSLASLIGLVLSSRVGRNIGLVRTGSSFDNHSGLVSLLDCGAHIDTAM
ncbi:unnamed protein product [Schistosoma mattheei]|uniref:Uncharacterized protein n=1 Tax=Schistosoma mattheei TaxID=31246 RepID=A0A3P7Y3U3_9TREM|nr:unnamed protein product [Schistosoma mattheei]